MSHYIQVNKRQRFWEFSATMQNIIYLLTLVGVKKNLCHIRLWNSAYAIFSLQVINTIIIKQFKEKRACFQLHTAQYHVFILSSFLTLRGLLTVHGPDALEALEVPEFDGHIGWAGGQQLSSLIKGDVLHGVRMSLQSSLEISCFVVPHLQTHKHTLRTGVHRLSTPILWHLKEWGASV